MKLKPLHIVLLGAAALLLIPVAGAAAAASVNFDTIVSAADTVIKSFEGFSSTPYWDVSRYSWGFGTAAPGPTGSISVTKAQNDMNAIVQNDYNILSNLITRPLSVNQWAAYLSFSFNEGIGNAENLVADINAGDDSVLQNHWKQYIYAGGVVSPILTDRRNQEWALWNS